MLLAILMVFVAVSCEEEPVHEHVYGKEWKSDATNHWHECECGEKNGVSAHEFVWMVVEGERYQECSVCGYTTEKTEVLTATDEASLRAAISDGSKTIYLINDINVTQSISIDSGKEITIDLNGKNIAFDSKFFQLNADGENGGGALNVVGKGKISNTSNFVFQITGTSNPEGASCNLSIGRDVEVEGAYAISVYPESKKKVCYNVKIDVYGKVSGKQPIFVNGTISNSDDKAVKLVIHNNAIVSSPDYDTIYLAGYAITSIEEDARIESPKNAITIAAGELEINGAIVVGGDGQGFDAGSGGSISSNQSSAVYVKQHTTNLPVKVTINSGSFSAYIPFYQDNGQASSPKPEDVKIAINGGAFTNAEGSVSIKSKNKTGFISGGIFSTEPEAVYIAEGYKAIADGANWKVVSKYSLILS